MPASTPQSVDGDEEFRARKRRFRAIGIGCLIVGLGARIWLISVSAHHKSPWDHHEYVRWGNQASADGVLSLYVSPPAENQIDLPDRGRVTVHHREQYICNYPPLAAYVFALLGKTHRVFDADAVSNTTTAHLIYSAPSVAADILLAWGCLAIVGSLRSRAAGVAAFGVVFLLPPFMLDSCFWGQTDSWVLAPGVWMVYAMMRRRWLWAGVWWGTALALKTQAVLLAPIWGFAALVVICGSASKDRMQRLAGITGGVFCGLVWLNVLAVPFWLSSGSAWVQNSVIRNLRDESPKTTLKSFNVWYVDLLLTEDADSGARLLGTTKDRWGKGLVLAGLMAAGVLAWRVRARSEEKLVVFCGLWLLLVVMLATRVHERYLLLSLPFLLCMAVTRRGYWIGVALLVVVASFQVTVFQWMDFGAGNWSEYEAGARAYHARALRETPIELLDQLPTFEQAMSLARDEYAKKRAPDKPMEWGLTLAALVGTLAVLIAALVAFDPRGEPGAREVRA